MHGLEKPGRVRHWPAWLHKALGVLALAAATSTWASPAMHRVGPTPDWVEPVVPEEVTPPPEQVSEGKQYLLFDTQTRVDGADKVTFRHVAVKALNERGVEQAANIELGFDPSYQTLTLHAINLRRDGRVIGKLAAARVEVLQREAGLESLIYDGSRTAHVFLEDVRVGDVVEYAYSLRGHNPVFAGRHFSGFSLQYGVPVARLHARLLWPAGRPIHWRLLNAAPEPVAATTGAYRAYTWDQRGVAARTVESDSPSWFDPYPAVQWSEFADWAAVRDWALPLYRRETAGPRVQAAIRQLAAQHAEPAQRLAAALQYVQAEVRYLGIEVGPGSHAPNRPELVLERRYGDCKDKTLLLLTLLQGLGIEAAPALVHTELRHSIESFQPSPGAFNHVLVRAQVDGQTYWLDPTRAPQRGQLAQITQVDFGRALVVATDARGLSPMAGDAARVHRREVRATLDARNGVGKPARYTVATTAHGAAAEALRAALGTQSREALQKQYLNFYAGYFGDADVAAPLDVHDDLPTNRLTVTEHYLLKEFWKHSGEKARTDAQIEVPDLSEYLRRPASLVRHAPLAIGHPARLEVVTEVQLPEPWDIKLEETEVEDAAFRFSRRMAWDERLRLITFTDQYESLADHVMPEELARHADKLAKARLDSSYVLFKQDAAPAAARGGSIYWLPAVVGTLVLLGSAWGARRLYHWDPAPPAAASAEWAYKPDGIGGWLWLPALGLPLSVLRVGNDLLGLWPALSTERWLQVADPSGGAYHPLFGPVLIFELVINLVALAALVLLMLLFYRRRTSTPRLYVVVLPVMAMAVALDTLLAGVVSASEVSTKDWSDVARQMLFALAWSAYFLRSERVKHTFRSRLRPSPTATAPAAVADAADTAA